MSSSEDASPFIRIVPLMAGGAPNAADGGDRQLVVSSRL